LTIVKDVLARHVRTLCRWAASLHLDSVPSSTLAHAVLVLGDNLAAILSAADEPEIRAWHERVLRAPCAQESTLFMPGAPRVSLVEAAVANGLAATWNELDEGYTRTAVHPGALSQPLILAAAEESGASLGATLRAVIGAYEIGTRFARAWPGTLPRLHPHGAYNAVCAAAGLSLLRNFDAGKLEAALTAAATMVSPGPYSHPIEGALVRNAWPAAGAWLGLFACDLAEIGIGGLAGGVYDVFEGCLGAPSLPEELVNGLGSDWTICAGYHKLYPACHHSHAAMEALQALKLRHPELAGGDTVEEVLVEGSAMAFNFSNAEPATTLAAKFSIPHAVAGVIAGDAQQPALFGADGLNDPRIAALRRRVRLAQLAEVQPWPRDRPARVTVKLRDGRVLVETCEAALGSPLRPLSADQVLEKIDKLGGRDAPGLAGAIGALRAQAQRGALPDVTCRDWIGSLFTCAPRAETPQGSAL
jgi:2-methylcitrate dehydratase PrpD